MENSEELRQLGIEPTEMRPATEAKVVSIPPGTDMNVLVRHLEEFEYLRIRKETEIPVPVDTIKIGNGVIASPANLTVISAAAKAGKTAFVGAIMAGAISSNGVIDGFRDLHVLPNAESHAVIHFDTEQSRSDQQHHVNTVLRRCNEDKTPEHFLSYNLRQLSFEDYEQKTSDICRSAFEKFGGIYLIVIDGIADYISSVNDEAAATKVVAFFTHLAVQYNCPIILIIHTNPAPKGIDPKERGHLGSQLQRKCFSLLTITKDGDTSTAQPKIMRKAGLADIPLIHFKYDKVKRYHTDAEAPDKSQAKTLQDFQYIEKLARSVFPPPSAFNHSDSVERIQKETRKSESTAKTYLKNMKAWGIVDLGVDKNYRLKVE